MQILGLVLFLCAALSAQQKTVQVTKTNNDKISGQFLGTYMDHIHLLVNSKVVYMHCQDLRSVKKGASDFPYDCSKNTIAPDTLFPHQFDPMTGKVVQMIPDVFRNRSLSKQNNNPILSKPAQSNTKTNENTYMTRKEILDLINTEINDQVKLEIANQLAQKHSTQNFKNKKKDQNKIFVEDPVLRYIAAFGIAFIIVNIFLSIG